MHLFRKTLSAPSRSADSAVSPNKKYGESMRLNPLDEDERSAVSEKKLTRQRKLRYATDEELGLNWIEGNPRSPSNSNHSHWFATAQPLPLPASPSTNKASKLSVSLRHQPASPDAMETGFSTVRRNSSDQAASTLCRSAPSSGSYAATQSPDSAVMSKHFETLRLHIPPRSAPTSGFSSPNVSPQIPSPVDIFCFNFQTESPQDPSAIKSPNNVRRGSPKSAPSSGLASPNLYSPESSPLQSPDLHKPSLSSKKGHKPQNNGQASSHPLPLPPVLHSPSSTPQASFMPSPPRSGVHNISCKTEGRTLWQKGPLIGRGTYGSVFHGTHRITGASCAIKEVDIIPDDLNSNERVKQLDQEINVLSHLEHRNIVRYYGSEIIGDHLNIYLEYVHPGSLSRYVKERCGNMTESIVRNFTRHILCGLAYLHSRKTVHRDIKGANLLVDQTGTVKLADFGTAKHLTGLSSQLSLKGSPHWMAPELMKAVMQKDSTPELAFAVDIWSLGCTIIEMFTGKPPWGDLSGPQAMFKVLNRSPTIPEKLSSEGKDFLSLCFQRDPAERPSASSLLEHSFVKSCDSMEKNLKGDHLLSSSSMPRHSVHATASESNMHSYSRVLMPSRRSSSGLHNFISPADVCNLRPLLALSNHPLAQQSRHGREVPHV